MMNREAFIAKLDRKIPPHMQEGLTAYVYEGRPPGDFLRAVLEDKLVESFSRADTENSASMRGWADVMYNYVPYEARGSGGEVAKWIQHNGLHGKEPHAPN